MKTIFKFLILSLALFIAGCSGGSGGSLFSGGGSSNVGPSSEDDIGDGVEMRVSSLDSSDILSTRSVFFSIEFRNENVESIELDKNNFRIKVIPGGERVFTSESMNEVFDAIFRDGTAYISKTFNIEQEGLSLTIDDSNEAILRSFLDQDITLFFILEYEEEFEQFVNLNLNFEDNDVNSEEVVKKTGPLTVSSFELKRANTDSFLEFEISGDINAQTKLKLSRLEHTLGDDSLDCTYSQENGAVFDESNVQLTSNNKLIKVFCDIPKSTVETYSDDTTFTFHTSLDYEYAETQSQSFRLPNDFLN